MVAGNVRPWLALRCLFVVTLLLTAIPAFAQEPSSRLQNYVFVAPGTWNNFIENGASIHVGAGTEFRVYKGLGVGAELGPLIPWSPPGGFCCGSNNRVTGLGSADLSYHFLPNLAGRKVQPFVKSGYSLFFRQGTSSGYNVGGGIDLWPRNKVGMRFEVRYHSSYQHDLMTIGTAVTFR
jgi:hypothetical protein